MGDGFHPFCQQSLTLASDSPKLLPTKILPPTSSCQHSVVDNICNMLLTMKLKRRSMADTGNRRPVAVRASQSMVECFDTSLSITSSTERRNGPIRSKIGSMNNISHRPGGGQVKIESKRMSFVGVQSKVRIFQS